MAIGQSKWLKLDENDTVVFSSHPIPGNETAVASVRLDAGMAETVAAEMPSPEQIAANDWLPDTELTVFAEEFERTGFQGGLNWYRASGLGRDEMERFAGRTIDQPSLFIAGASDWGTHQSPGRLDRMKQRVCTDLRGVHLVDGAGHWVQQERPAETTALIVDFLAGSAGS